MITICQPIESVAKIIEKTKCKPENLYRLSNQCVKQQLPNGLILYHTMTCELLLLDEEEADVLSCLPGSVPERLNPLVYKRFLVPVDENEMTYCEQFRKIMAFINQKDDAITSYTILTTTDCNARCFYCYELGRSRIPMSDETAQTAGEYIAAHSKGKKVSLHWFGGEPLFHSSAIDTIIGKLNEKEIAFSSSMISNGYLFDEEMVKKAKDAWHLHKIQITLDGTEEVYNRRKAYIYKDGSAYQRVLRNIGLLLDAEIGVSIRLNLDMDNKNDLIALVDELANKFADKKGVTVYNHIIFEKPEKPRSIDERKALYQASNELTTHIVERGMSAKGGVPRAFKTNWCMADNDSSIIILPDGRLGKCEHHSESETWGELRSDEKDETLLSGWKKRMPPLSECKECFLYPQCIRLDKCPNHFGYCDSEYRDEKKKQFQRQMLNSYEKWKKVQTDNP